MAKQRVLGRGLDALLGGEEQAMAVGEETLRHLAIDMLEVGKYQPRTRMDDVGTALSEQRAQAADMQQRQRRLSADRKRDVFGAASFELRHQPAACGNDDGTMPGAHQRFCDFQRGPLDAARVQRRQQLHDGKAARHGADVRSQSIRTYCAPQYGQADVPPSASIGR